MYRNRTLVRAQGIRVYYNEHEAAEVQEGANQANYERAAFIRDASLVVARYIKRMREQKREVSLADLQARLSGDFRFLLA